MNNQYNAGNQKISLNFFKVVGYDDITRTNLPLLAIVLILTNKNEKKKSFCYALEFRFFKKPM